MASQAEDVSSTLLSDAEHRNISGLFIEEGLENPLGGRGAQKASVSSSADLQAEAGAINVLQHRIQDAILIWKEIGLEQLKFSLDEQAVKMSELKEDYIKRRKGLAASIKSFSVTYLQPSEGDDDNEANDWKAPTSELLEMFKGEYDALSIFTKFAETAFLSVFKSFREAEDPVVVLSDASALAVNLKEMLDVAVSQMDDPSRASNDNIGSRAQYVAEQEAIFSNKFKIEIASLREKYDIELRNREQDLRARFERNLLDIQHSYESTIARKDSELTSLLNSMKLTAHQSQESTEVEMMLEAEVEKRRIAEEKARAALTDLAEMQLKLSGAQSHLDEANKTSKNFETALRRREGETSNLSERYEAELAVLKKKYLDAELELSSRPPITFESLIEKIGVFGNFSSIHDQSLTKKISWLDLEGYIVECIRRTSAEAAESRVKEMEALKKIGGLTSEVSDLTHQLKSKLEAINSLEKDLNEANFALQTGITKSKTKSAHYSESQFQAKLISNDMELEKQVTLANQSDSSINGGEALLHVVQGQRDRYMKAAKDKEQEVILLKTRLDRAQEDQIQLRADNLELYKRLRILRANNRGDPRKDRKAASTPSKARIRKGTVRGLLGFSSASENVDEELGEEVNYFDNYALDTKYSEMYEEQIDPFKIEDMDRRNLFSKMNIFERGLVNTVRFFMQDQWARHALLVYLLVVHAFAVGYVLKVLNPELIGEFSLKTLSNLEMNKELEHN